KQPGHFQLNSRCRKRAAEHIKSRQAPTLSDKSKHIGNGGRAARVGHDSGQLRGSEHADFPAKQAAAVLHISSIANGDIAGTVRAAVLGERAESLIADNFMSTDDQPAALQVIRSVPLVVKNARSTENQ